MLVSANGVELDSNAFVCVPPLYFRSASTAHLSATHAAPTCARIGSFQEKSAFPVRRRLFVLLPPWSMTLSENTLAAVTSCAADGRSRARLLRWRGASHCRPMGPISAVAELETTTERRTCPAGAVVCSRDSCSLPARSVKSAPTEAPRRSDLNGAQPSEMEM